MKSDSEQCQFLKSYFRVNSDHMEIQKFDQTDNNIDILELTHSIFCFLAHKTNSSIVVVTHIQCEQFFM